MNMDSQDQYADSRTLWLGDLDVYMDEIFLNNLTKSLGYAEFLASLKVIKDKETGVSNKYGFLEFKTHRIAAKFMHEFNGKPIPTTNNKYFKIKWAAYGGGIKITPTSTPGDISIYVGDLDHSITETKLYEFFKAKYPSVYTSKIIYDGNRVSKGYGFVKFTNSEEAQKAIVENNGGTLNGRTIKVSHAYLKNKEEKEEEETGGETYASKMIKVYKKFYAMNNDPLLKLAYEKQLHSTLGLGSDQTPKNKTVKERLEAIRVLPYDQTQSSEKYLDVLIKSINYSSKQSVQRLIFS